MIAISTIVSVESISNSYENLKEQLSIAETDQPVFISL